MKQGKQHASRHRGHELRGLICEEAARLMVDDDIRDFFHAKRKAAAKFHSHNQNEWPSNEEVETARKARLTIFRFDEQSIRVKQEKFRQAETGMRLLHAYQPRLTGQLVYGGVTENSPIEIHLFADTVEEVLIELEDQGIHTQLAEKNYRYPGATSVNIPLITTEIDGHEVLLSIFPTTHIRQKPLSPIDGLSMKRWSLRELQSQT